MNKYNFEVSNFQNEDFSFSNNPETIVGEGENEISAAIDAIEKYSGITISNDIDSLESINLVLEPSLIFIKKLSS